MLVYLFALVPGGLGIKIQAECRGQYRGNGVLASSPLASAVMPFRGRSEMYPSISGSAGLPNRGWHGHGARSLFIVDDNITLNVRRFEALCQPIIDAGLNDLEYTVRATTSAIANHGERLARLMREAGFLAAVGPAPAAPSQPKAIWERRRVPIDSR